MLTRQLFCFTQQGILDVAKLEKKNDYVDTRGSTYNILMPIIQSILASIYVCPLEKFRYIFLLAPQESRH